jgi:hypothetical protein
MEAHPNFKALYPLSTALGLHPVTTGKDLRNFSDIVQHEGFDIDEVQKALGSAKFAAFAKTLTQVFCCAHRNWPANHVEAHKRNCEVHCVYADTLEQFLQKEGT